MVLPVMAEPTVRVLADETFNVSPGSVPTEALSETPPVAWSVTRAELLALRIRLALLVLKLPPELLCSILPPFAAKVTEEPLAEPAARAGSAP